MIQIPVFIASPTDISEERIIAEEVINEISRKVERKYNISLNPVKWESFSSLTRSDGKHPQFSIFPALQNSQIFIGMVHTRYGSEIEGIGKSGTETEFDQAIEHRDRIKILTYFKHVSDSSIKSSNPEQVEQLSRLNKLKVKLREKNVFFHEFFTSEEFRSRLTQDLFMLCLDYIRDPNSFSEKYNQFFHLNAEVKDEKDATHIVYPAFESFSIKFNPDWRRHLVPMVVFEDFKAIQKTEYILRLIGNPYKIVTVNSSEYHSANPGDRVWICLPRNGPAKSILDDLGDRVNFRFLDTEALLPPNYARRLEWKKGSGESIVVTSPLGQYLQLQGRKPESQWDQRFSNVIARDFAIIARFRVNSNGRKGHFHYFLGGLRGLGTWGAGWHLEKNINEIIEKHETNDTEKDVQILIRVTYIANRIIETVDVSHKPQEYFDEQISQQYIKDECKKVGITTNAGIGQAIRKSPRTS